MVVAVAVAEAHLLLVVVLVLLLFLVVLGNAGGFQLPKNYCLAFTFINFNA